MTVLENMKKILSESGGYVLAGNSPVDIELAVYAEGFSPLEAGLSKLAGDIFASTASEDILTLWERLFRPQVCAEAREIRQRMVKNLLAAHLERLSEEDYKPILEAAGLKGCLKENEGVLTVYFGEFLGLPEEEVLKELNRLLPAHLTWEIVREYNWLAIDATHKTFSERDALGLSWAELDALTWEQLQTYQV